MNITSIIIPFLLLGGVAAALLLIFLLFRERKPNNIDTPYQFAVGLALTAAFLLIWVNGAVGIIGASSNDANMMYFGVLVLGIFGALIADFQPRGMAWTLFAMALAQALVTGIAVAAGLGSPASPALEIVMLNGFFVALWAGSAWLFRKSARGRPEQV